MPSPIRCSAAPRLRWIAPLAFAAVAQLAPPALAQPPAKANTTTSLIQRGGALFEDQQYEESIQTLSAALLRPSNTKAQKIEIYRLLALNYITLNRKVLSEMAIHSPEVFDEVCALVKTALGPKLPAAVAV